MSPSIEIEIDEYQLQRAVTDAIDEADIENAVRDAAEEGVDKALTDANIDTTIVDAVVEGFQEANFIDALTAIRDRLDALDEQKSPEPDSSGTFYGFRSGEEVILFNKLHPNGLRGTVSSKQAALGNWTNVIPVLRHDTKTGDIFPVQQTILAGPLDEYLASRVGAVVEEARAEIERPSGDPITHNLKAFEKAIESQLGTTFAYVTPAPSYLSHGQDTEKERRFRPSSIDRIGPEDRQSIVRGFDLDAQDVRAFRVDRIKGYITVDKSI